MRFVALLFVTGCATSGVSVTRQGSSAVLTVDLDHLPAPASARAERLAELAAQTCSPAAGRVTSQTPSTRNEVQLDLDQVVTSVERRPATSAWAPAPPGQSVFTSRSTIPPTQPVSDERATHVTVPVVEVVVECGG